MTAFLCLVIPYPCSRKMTKSKVLTRYHLQLFPEKMVSIIEPRIKGTIIDSSNILVITSEPLIPNDGPLFRPTFNEMPPFDIDSETDKDFPLPHYFLEINPSTELCSGHFCDGQGSSKTLCV